MKFVFFWVLLNDAGFNAITTLQPMWMYNKWMEVNPKDIIWSNLDDGALEMKTRYATSWVATVGLIILWAFPVSFIGALSNLSDLCIKVQYVVPSLDNFLKTLRGVPSWLAWVCRGTFDRVQIASSTLTCTLLAPAVARGLIEGVLPPLLLAVLFALLPFALRGE